VKERIAFDVMAKSGDGSIAHDDRLLLRGQKHKVGLHVDYRNATNIKHTGTGEPEIVSYHRTNEQGEHERVSVSTWELLDTWDKVKFRPQYLRGIELGRGAALVLRDNQFDLRLDNLFDDLGSRYRSALEAMVALQGRGVLRYEPRSEPTERNRLEAMRNRLRRTLQPVVYEHDILFRGELGKRIYDDLVNSGKAKYVIPGTVYLSGFNPYKGRQVSIKYYDIGKRDGEAGSEYFKLETTLHKAYFKAEDIEIRRLTEQPVVQETVKDKLTRSVSSVVALLTGDTMQALQLNLAMDANGVKSDRLHTEVARNMLDRKRTLTERVETLERDMREVKRRLGMENSR